MVMIVCSLRKERERKVQLDITRELTQCSVKPFKQEHGNYIPTDSFL